MIHVPSHRVFPDDGLSDVPDEARERFVWEHGDFWVVGAPYAGNPTADPDVWDPIADDVELADRVAMLEQMIAQGSVPEDVVVWRGIASPYLASTVDDDWVGARLFDRSFISCALYRSVAERCLEDRPGGVLVQILVDEGTPVAPLGLIGRGRPGHVPTELLFGRDAVLTVVSVHRDPAPRIVASLTRAS